MDEAVFQFVNGYAGISESRDVFLRAISLNPLVKTLPIIAAFWYLWFQMSDDRARAGVVASFVVGTISIAVARVLALFLPYAMRPMHQEGVLYRLPLGMEPDVLSGWSSMPSDHAVFNVTLAACLFALHRRLGLWALLHVAIVICLPRIYLGLHWPSDILVGAVIGVAVAVVALRPATDTVQRLGVMAWAARAPGAFHVLLLMLGFQLATNFNSLRELVSALRHGLGLSG